MASDYSRKLVQAKICPELFAMVDGEWTRRKLSTTDVVAIALGMYFDRPDLGYVVRIPDRDRKSKGASRDAVKAFKRLALQRSFSVT